MIFSNPGCGSISPIIASKNWCFSNSDKFIFVGEV